MKRNDSSKAIEGAVFPAAVGRGRVVVLDVLLVLLVPVLLVISSGVAFG